MREVDLSGHSSREVVEVLVLGDIYQVWERNTGLSSAKGI